MERKGNREGKGGGWRKRSQKPGAETPTFSAVWHSVTPRGAGFSPSPSAPRSRATTLATIRLCQPNQARLLPRRVASAARRSSQGLAWESREPETRGQLPCKRRCPASSKAEAQAGARPRWALGRGGRGSAQARQAARKGSGRATSASGRLRSLLPPVAARPELHKASRAARSLARRRPQPSGARRKRNAEPSGVAERSQSRGAQGASEGPPRPGPPAWP